MFQSAGAAFGLGQGPPGPARDRGGGAEDDESDDILPDTNINRERTLTGKFALGTFVIVAVFITLSFCTPNWIEGDPRFYGTKVERVGLWVHCFRSLPDHHDLNNRRFFAGCRWIFNPFTEGYDRIRNFLTPRKLLLSVILASSIGVFFSPATLVSL